MSALCLTQSCCSKGRGEITPLGLSIVKIGCLLYPRTRPLEEYSVQSGQNYYECTYFSTLQWSQLILSI